MKSVLNIYIVLMFLLFILISCSKTSELRIIGKWQDESDRFYEKHTYEFFKNGKYLKNSNGHIKIGTYKIRDDIFYIDEMKPSGLNIIWLNDDKIVIENYYNPQDLVLRRLN